MKTRLTQLPMTEELRQLCKSTSELIAAGDRGVFVESDDLIQTDSFCGGWCAESRAFWFSYYADDGCDYIFSLTVEQMSGLADGLELVVPLEYWKRWDSGGR